AVLSYVIQNLSERPDLVSAILNYSFKPGKSSLNECYYFRTPRAPTKNISNGGNVGSQPSLSTSALFRLILLVV
ncbi:MAG: hypothetical protein K6U74_05620, partial [Firmicutes bacterium]|nr:hypothetical protein [Bacillota bacterium]